MFTYVVSEVEPDYSDEGLKTDLKRRLNLVVYKIVLIET